MTWYQEFHKKSELKRALEIKPQAKVFIELADFFRKYRWQNKELIRRFCLIEMLMTHFEPDMNKTFNREIDDEHEAYMIIHYWVMKKLPSCHRCSCGAEGERSRYEHYYSEMFNNHYDLKKSAREKRVEFEAIKRKPEFHSFVLAQIKKQNFFCFYCHEHVTNEYHVDHQVPLSKGGSNNTKNLVISCSTCNLVKSDKVDEDFGFDPEYVDWVRLEYKEDIWIPVATM